MAPDEQALALVIDGSPEGTQVVRALLEREGYAVEVTPEGRRGLAYARARQPELVILDLALRDANGMEVCRELRRFTDAYVVMVSDRDRDVDKVVGLAVGADDFVVKPYSPHELTARVRALRRRPRIPAPRQPRDFGRLVVDPGAREVCLDGAPVPLTRIEFDLLELLSRQPRCTVTRKDVLAQIWGPWFGDDHVIEVHLAKLRRKLGETAAGGGHIATVRGVGYRFDPP